MIPSFCSNCGGAIIWCQKDQGTGFHRPLDAMTGQNGFILVDGDLHVGTLYQLHVCHQGRYAPANPPEDVGKNVEVTVAEYTTPWGRREPPEHDLTQEEEENLPDEAPNLMNLAQQERVFSDLTVEQTLEEEHQQALQEIADNQRERHQWVANKRKCPYCLASRGTLCWDMHALRYGRRRHANVVHPERTDNAEQHSYNRPPPPWL